MNNRPSLLREPGAREAERAGGGLVETPAIFLSPRNKRVQYSEGKIVLFAERPDIQAFLEGLRIKLV